MIPRGFVGELTGLGLACDWPLAWEIDESTAAALPARLPCKRRRREWLIRGSLYTIFLDLQRRDLRSSFPKPEESLAVGKVRAAQFVILGDRGLPKNPGSIYINGILW